MCPEPWSWFGNFVKNNISLWKVPSSWSDGFMICFTGNTGLYHDWMVPLWQLVVLLHETAMYLYFLRLQTMFMHLMWKPNSWVNGQLTIHILFQEGSKSFLERLLGSHSHLPLAHYPLLSTAPGILMIKQCKSIFCLVPTSMGKTTKAELRFCECLMVNSIIIQEILMISRKWLSEAS